MSLQDSRVSVGIISKPEFVEACKRLARRSAGLELRDLVIEHHNIDQYLTVKKTANVGSSATGGIKSIDCVEERRLEDSEVCDKVASFMRP